MMKTRIKEQFKRPVKYFLFITIFILISMGLLFLVRPPGQSPHHLSYEYVRHAEQPYMITEGKLPGVTWVDDIHPIFVKNGCGNCHTRGKEAAVEGLMKFALGLIDYNSPLNAYYSYHELVYSEGHPQINDGESLRDGQCCWPRNYEPEQQRRIWVGHPERSALMRKLDRDYYDWNKPPRFLEEALRLQWGPPMPWMHEGSRNPHDQKEGGKVGVGHKSEPTVEKLHKDTGNHHGNTYGYGQTKDSHKESAHAYKVPSLIGRIVFNALLWFGQNQDRLQSLPPKIPEKDRALLRYYISHTVQLKTEGTALEVLLRDHRGHPLTGATILFIGNFNNTGREKINDWVLKDTDSSGKAILKFEVPCVITSTWFVSAEVHGKKTKFRHVPVVPGHIKKIDMIL